LLQLGSGSVFSKRDPGLSQCRGARGSAQCHGRQHARFFGGNDRLCRWPGARYGVGGPRQAAEPSHPGWCGVVAFYNASSQRDDRGALSAALNSDLPGHYATHAAVVAAYGQLGEKEAARKAAGELLTLRPNVSNTVRKDFEKLWTPEYVERFIEGLRKAGNDCR